MKEVPEEQIIATQKEVIQDAIDYILEQMDMKRCGDIVVSISIRSGIPTKIERKFCEHFVHYEKTKKFATEGLISDNESEKD